MKLKFLVLIFALGLVGVGVGVVAGVGTGVEERRAMEIPQDPLNFTEIQLHFADDAFFQRHVAQHGLGIGPDVPERVMAFLNLISVMEEMRFPYVESLMRLELMERWGKNSRRPAFYDWTYPRRVPRSAETFAIRYLNKFSTFNIYERGPIFSARDAVIFNRPRYLVPIGLGDGIVMVCNTIHENISRYQKVGVRTFAITAAEQENDLMQQVVIVEHFLETSRFTEGVRIRRHRELVRVSDDPEWGRVASNVFFDEFLLDELLNEVLPGIVREQFYPTPTPAPETPSRPSAGAPVLTVPVQTTPRWIRHDFEVEIDINAVRELIVQDINNRQEGREDASDFANELANELLDRFKQFLQFLDEFERNPNSLISTYDSSRHGAVVLLLIPQGNRWSGSVLTYPWFELLNIPPGTEIGPDGFIINSRGLRNNVYELISEPGIW